MLGGAESGQRSIGRDCRPRSCSVALVSLPHSCVLHGFRYDDATGIDSLLLARAQSCLKGRLAVHAQTCLAGRSSFFFNIFAFETAIICAFSSYDNSRIINENVGRTRAACAKGIVSSKMAISGRGLLVCNNVDFNAV